MTDQAQNYELLKVIIGSAGFLGMMAGIALLIFRTGKIVQKIDCMESDIKFIKSDIHSIKNDLRCLEGRMYFIEGAFGERSKWEGRQVK